MALPETAVPDTAVFVRFFFPYHDAEQAGADALRVAWLADEVQLVQLDLVVYEFVNVVTRILGHVADQATDDVVNLFRLQMPIIRVDTGLASDAAALAAGLGLSGYDAAFLASARRLGIPLITPDRRLATAGGADVLPLDAMGE
jgi:predicted nucleic acid-binding protein